MGKVAIITEQQKDLILNHKYDGVVYFNPIVDNDGNWVISKEEIKLCIIEEFDFLKALKLKKHTPKITEQIKKPTK